MIFQDLSQEFHIVDILKETLVKGKSRHKTIKFFHFISQML